MAPFVHTAMFAHAVAFVVILQSTRAPWLTSVTVPCAQPFTLVNALHALFAAMVVPAVSVTRQALVCLPVRQILCALPAVMHSLKPVIAPAPLMSPLAVCS